MPSCACPVYQDGGCVISEIAGTYKMASTQGEAAGTSFTHYEVAHPFSKMEQNLDLRRFSLSQPKHVSNQCKEG